MSDRLFTSQSPTRLTGTKHCEDVNSELLQACDLIAGRSLHSLQIG